MAPSVGAGSAMFAPAAPFPTGSTFTDAMYNAEVLALRNWLTARFAWLNTAIMDL